MFSSVVTLYNSFFLQACDPVAESICGSATTSEVSEQNDVESSAEVCRKFATGPASAIYSSPVSEVGSTRGSVLCSDSTEKPVDSLSEWLDGDSSEMGTPDIQSALTENIVDLSPNSKYSFYSNRFVYFQKF